MNVVETIEKSLFMWWKVLAYMTNYTQSIRIVEGNNTIDTIKLNKNEIEYLYNINKLNSCSEYNINLCVETNITGCSDSMSVRKFISGDI